MYSDVHEVQIVAEGHEIQVNCPNPQQEESIKIRITNQIKKLHDDRKITHCPFCGEKLTGDNANWLNIHAFN
jgi:hypothetical protein